MLMKRAKGRQSFWGTMLMVVMVAAAALAAADAQAGAQNAAKDKDIVGTWQGTLHAGRDLRVVEKITKDAKGAYKAQFFSIDQGGQPIPVDSVVVDGSTVTMKVGMIGGNYEGKLSADGNTIDGQWTQGPNPLPLVLTRATPETAWTIPTPPPPVPPMADNADPSFEVATIKPSVPGRRGKGFGFNGREWISRNTNLDDLIAFAYGLHTKQLEGAPDWAGADLYDIDGLPDAPGRPSQKQQAVMVQKMLASRFGLKFHTETKELSVYVITVAKSGPKLTAATEPANAPMAFFFRGLGDLTVRNQTMKQFAEWMQSGVMDRPVVDQTGLTGRYDFQLKWTPDDTQFLQFRGTGVVVPPENNDPNAPPNLYTAIQQQLGLKIDATKAPDEVLVIDHVDHPSPN